MSLKSLFLGVLLFGFGIVQAQTAQEYLADGNSAYNEGNYTNAIDQYNLVLSMEMHSAALYFNLGNAHYKLGNVAESIFYFEKAKQLAPQDKEIENNSLFAKNMTLDSIEILPKTQLKTLSDKVLSIFTLDQWALFSIILLWLSIFFFVFYRISKKIELKRILFVLGVLFLLLFSVTIGLTETKNSQEKIKYGIIFSEEIQIWGEPNERADILFLLHQGTSVEVIDELEGWSKIRLANGSEGWIKNQGIRLLN
jgi:tetratricopeptide (TPR) repeat protein